MVYVTNNDDASLSVINGATCNRLIVSGCSLVPSKLAAGDYPDPIAVDPAVGTAYVGRQGGVSVIPLTH
jgi:DNA-binding beta-propeller fold protein YncE